MNKHLVENRKESLDKIIKNNDVPIQEKLTKVIAWGKEYGLLDIESKVEKVISAKRLWFIKENRVRYISLEGKEKEYTVKQMIKVAIKVGDWRDQMKILGISDKDVLDIFCKVRDKHYLKGNVYKWTSLQA